MRAPADSTDCFASRLTLSYVVVVKFECLEISCSVSE